ncbi:MAG: hypothetical protein ISS70_01545 [Phycisphaerae bacterium]|nr:hypothetical protein [Phycisphaerae bacterium]
MYRNNRTKLPTRTDQDYVVYFYESGLSTQYQQRQKNLLTKSNYGPTAVYDFSSDLFRKPTWPVQQTVEDVIRNGYFSIPKSEPETAIISDRKHTAWLGLDDIVGQIRNRYEVYRGNIYDIEVAKCAVINTFYTHEAWHGPSDSRVEYSVNKRLDGLYESQRDERINLWRDVSKLRLLLPETAHQYLRGYRKVAILEDPKGDEP